MPDERNSSANFVDFVRTQNPPSTAPESSVPSLDMSFRFARFLSITFVLLLGGCASWRSIVPLNEDRLNAEAGFDSVLLCRIKLEDSTKTVKNWGQPQFVESYLGATPDQNRMGTYIIEEPWEEKPDANILQSAPRLAIISGKHQLLSIGFFSIGSNSARGFPIKRDFTIPSRTLAYLGEIRVVAKPQLQFDSFITVNEEQMRADVASFKEKFPSLYEQLKGNIQVVQTTPSAPEAVQ